MKEFSIDKRKKILNSTRLIADWFVNHQIESTSNQPAAGSTIFGITSDGQRYIGNNWNHAFISMGLLSAAKVFDDHKYANAAFSMINYLKSLQIFSPFLAEHYGAIREITPQTPWCYVRDALSGAWGFLEFYRYTGEPEYLERARLWGEWFLKHGMDETCWPYWGINFSSNFPNENPQMCNNMHGSFHGGSLNFFYHLYLETQDKKWVGAFFEHMADYYVSNIQQSDGFFRTIEKSTGKTPANDPQSGLHRANDDLGTLGLLCAYQIYPKPEYLTSIKKFLNAVIFQQQIDGNFEKSCAANPVILNIIHESANFLSVDFPEIDQARAIDAFFKRQYISPDNPDFFGGIDECAENGICVRSMGYALIVFLKLFAGDCRFLQIKKL